MENYFLLAEYWVDEISSTYSQDYRVQCYKGTSEMQNLRFTTTKSQYEHPDSSTGVYTGYKVTVEISSWSSELSQHDYPTRYSFERVGENLKRVDYIDLSYVNNMSRMFYGCHNFIGFYYNPETNPYMFGIGHLVTDTSYMFCDCYSLRTSGSLNTAVYPSSEVWLDMTLWSFNTSNVTNMKGMFKGIRSCDHIIIPDTFDTSNVTDMSEMFYGYDHCKTLSLPANFNTSNVTDMSRMFTLYHYDEELDRYGGVVEPNFGSTSLLESLDLSMFDTTKVKKMDYMFAGLYNLKELNLNGFDTSSITKMEYMFTYCKSLEELDISGFDLKNISSLSGTFAYCEGLKTLNMNDVNAPLVTDLEGFLKGCVNLEHLELNGFYAPKVTNTSHLFEDLAKLQYVDISGLSTENVTDMSYMFKGCSALTSLDVSGLSTSKVTNMAHMFDGCSQVPVIDVSTFDTTNVKNIEGMFKNCKLVTELDVSNFASTGLTSFEELFSGCNNITEIDLSKLGTQDAITSTKNMFSCCYNLKTIKMCGLVSNDIIDTSSMFFGCNKLESIIGGALYTDNVTNMMDMFNGCSLLVEIPYITEFRTSNVTNMSFMFAGCQSLLSLDVSKFDTSKVTKMNHMFAGCKLLTSIDTSKFDTNKVTTMKSMFEGCEMLRSVKYEELDVSNVKDMSRMFKDCKQIGTLHCNHHSMTKVETMESMLEGCDKLQYAEFSITPVNGVKFSNLVNLKNLCKNCGWLEGIYFCNMNLSKMAVNDTTNDMEGIFEGCPNVEFIYLDRMNYGYNAVGINNFNWLVDHIRSQCVNLKELHLDNLTGQPLLTCKSLFKDFTKLEKIYLKDFDISRVDDISEMFMNCYNLKTIDLSNFDQRYANVYHMDSMFRNCTSLETLNINALKTNSLRTANDMFRNCSNLTQLVFAEENADSNNFEWLCLANGMFSGCNNMTYLEIPNFNVTRIGATKPTPTTLMNDMTDMFMGCAALKTVVLDNFKIDNTVAPDVGDISTVTREGDARLETFFTTLTTGAPNITKLVVTNFNNFYLTSMKGMFMNFKNVEEIVLTNCNTSRITDMTEMFRNCEKLNSLDLSSFNTRNVTTMKSMFEDTGQLTNLNISSFDFTNVTTLENLFKSSDVKYIDLANFNTTENVTNMYSMFFLCSKLTQIDNLNKLNTRNVTDMRSMFRGLYVITELDLSGFNTSKVTSMSNMFDGNKLIKTLDISHFDFTNVTNMKAMFEGCVSLNNIDLSHNTFGNDLDISYMFSGCISLERVDMSGIPISTKVVTPYTSSSLFYNCKSLNYLDISNMANQLTYINTNAAIVNPFNLTSINCDTLNIGMLYIDAETCSLYANNITTAMAVNTYIPDRINIYVLDADPAECSCDDPRVRFIKYEREEKTIELPETIPSGRKLKWDEEHREYYIVNQYGTMTPTGVKEKIKMETYDTTMFVDFHDLQGDGKIQVAMKEKIEEESEE